MWKSQAYGHQLRALARWPKDPLRPETQFQDAIRRRIDRRMGIVEDVGPKPETNPRLQSQTREPWDETAELEQANALYSLLDGRYAKKYPIANSLMKPASKPTYYTDLIRELEEAPKRGWLARTINRWKGFIRFQ